MILILTGHHDHSSDVVIDWLNFYGAKHVRLNDNDIILDEKLNFLLNNERTIIEFPDKINLLDTKAVWYRKFGLMVESTVDKLSKNELGGKLHDFFNLEFNAFMSYFDMNFHNNVKWLCDPNHIKGLTKIKQLLIAREVELDIPATLVTNDKQIAKTFFNKYKSCLTKPIGESEIIKHERKQYQITPKLLDKNVFKKIFSKRFFPSLLQEYLDKDVELRIFFLDDICYTMAIFSQLDEKTKIDFRHYNKEKPNRVVPFKLPKSIENKVIKFMNAVGLNTGSIDMIKTIDNRYVFLEVNPKGQFGMVSLPCNYYLEEKIALSLIQKLKIDVE
ncbi:grasp-with-spasm system ATP-grasp peptide maturase [Pedobacter alluvionis]|uniref:ATP-GRASP peptide maturase of grasp-with-spasm system n=1 Tax=Pedobacter alluvionis TaxID=475253 RepID=A0A497YCM1_9SPHI|nr:grasp-with-spasm system ATP-grasp peptide maturase [Pedobacter alluvionis]RLJ80217.1 ATP-GRASP peptide maturase of grasp-with-spasm system [Pedobacter alluvionis]TFB31498.1 grasp-with-spasm system ATP-grasp peptide maturase [Pedobacter alluvionis]